MHITEILTTGSCLPSEIWSCSKASVLGLPSLRELVVTWEGEFTFSEVDELPSLLSEGVQDEFYIIHKPELSWQNYN